MNYQEFLKSKNKRIDNQGIDIDITQVNDKLFDYQKDIVRWAVKKGRCAIFQRGILRALCFHNP